MEDEKTNKLESVRANCLDLLKLTNEDEVIAFFPSGDSRQIVARRVSTRRSEVKEVHVVVKKSQQVDSDLSDGSGC